MNLADYRTANHHNTNILSNCLKDRSTDISDIIFYEGVTGKDLSFDKLASKMYDVLACCAIGAVPSIESTGADGYIWFKEGHGMVPIETKLCAIGNKNIFVGPRGGLYWSSDPSNFYNRASLTSYFSGSFDSNMSNKTFKTKERWTSLICFDRDTNSIIDAWVMEPSVVINELRQRRNNASLTLKLNRFMDKGFSMKTTVPSQGYHVWEKSQTSLAREENRVAQW